LRAVKNASADDTIPRAPATADTHALSGGQPRVARKIQMSPKVSHPIAVA
jgi:hypothetical protein